MIPFEVRSRWLFLSLVLLSGLMLYPSRPDIIPGCRNSLISKFIDRFGAGSECPLSPTHPSWLTVKACVENTNTGRPVAAADCRAG